LIHYSNVRGVKIVVVFDAFHSGRAEGSRETLDGGVDVVYSVEMDADTWIQV
jgi:predicted RNA-binding protein with PIN domain